MEFIFTFDLLGLAAKLHTFLCQYFWHLVLETNLFSHKSVVTYCNGGTTCLCGVTTNFLKMKEIYFLRISKTSMNIILPWFQKSHPAFCHNLNLSIIAVGNL